MASSSSEVLRGGTAKAGVVVAVSQPATALIIRGQPADRHAQRVERIVVARAPDDPAGLERRALAAVVGAVRVGPVGGGRPLAEVAEQVLDAAPAGRRSPRSVAPYGRPTTARSSVGGSSPHG